MPITTRILFMFILLTVGIIIPSTVISLRYTDNRMRSTTISSHQLLLTQASTDYSRNVWELNQDSVLISLKGLFADPDVRGAWVFDGEGVLYGALERHGERITPLEKRDIPEARFRKLRSLLPDNPDNGKNQAQLLESDRNSYVIGITLFSLGTNDRKSAAIGHLLMESSFGTIDTEMANLRKQGLFLALLLASVLFGAVYFTLSRFIFNPLKLLQVASTQVAGGKWVHVKNSHRKDEMGKLIRSFNAMVSRIEGSQSDLLKLVEEGKNLVVVQNYADFKKALVSAWQRLTNTSCDCTIYLPEVLDAQNEVYSESNFLRMSETGSLEKDHFIRHTELDKLKGYHVPITNPSDGHILAHLCVTGLPDNGREFPSSQLSILEAFSVSVAIALRNLRYVDTQRRIERDALERETYRAVENHLEPTISALENGVLSVAGGHLSQTMTRGDWWHQITLDNGRIWVMVGLVDGNSTLAALTVSHIKGFIEGVGRISPLLGPAEILKQLSLTQIRMGNLPPSTLFFAQCDPFSGQVVWSNASFQAPILAMSDGKFARLLLASPRLGAPDGHTDYVNRELILNPGDKLLIHSPGLLNFRTIEGDFINAKRMERIIESAWGQGAQESIDTWLAEFKFLHGRLELSQDATMVVIASRQENTGHDLTPPFDQLEPPLTPPPSGSSA